MPLPFGKPKKPKLINCPDCDGAGCETCKGTGKLEVVDG